MKLSLCALLTAPLIGNAQQQLSGNAHYDFPENILRSGYVSSVKSTNATQLATSGHYFDERSYEDSALTKQKPINLSLQNKRIIDAKSFIIQKAAQYRILLINEAHYRPEHRLFTKSLLKDLHAVGYNVFMAEGIWPDNDLPNRAYPIATDGAFLNEPLYASLIRYAKANDYTVHAYEWTTKQAGGKHWDDSIKLDKNGSTKYISYDPRDSMTIIYDENKKVKWMKMTSRREECQAANILKVIQEHPNSKFIIHVGHGHLYEDGIMMGGKLRNLLQGEEILTIDQASLVDGVPIIDTITHEPIKNKHAFLIQDKTSYSFYTQSIAVDYQLFNGATTDSLGRPSFLFNDVEKRTVVKLPVDKLNNCPCLFTAYYEKELEKEKENAVAIDIITVRDSNPAPPFLLYSGKYTIVRKNKSGVYSNFKYTVK